MVVKRKRHLDTMLPFCPNDFDDNNITKIAARAEESRRQLARSAHSESSRQRSSTLRFQTPNGILRSRRSRMGLYSSEKSRSLRKTLKKVLDESRSFFFRVHTGYFLEYSEVYKSRVHRQLGMFSVQCCIELQALE
ncbi:hypothetical protein TNCV_4412791 [Trichonephila clavipes]|nr:hypothetical protein TNCV_4412791 [Trichonephila clavipes]